MKSFYKTGLFWVCIVELAVVVFLGAFGFRITYAPSLETSWPAVSAVADWIGALAGVGIPIAVVYLQVIIDRSKKDISGANADLLHEIDEMKREFQEKLLLLHEQAPIAKNAVPEPEEIRARQKEEALKFINISMMAHTQAVADKIGASKEDAFNLLLEMMMHDRSISCAGQSHISNIDGVLWMRRR